MGSGNRSDSRAQSENTLGTLSLAPILAGQAFGYESMQTPGGGLAVTGTGQAFPQIFNSGNLAGLQNLTTPYGAFQDPGLFSQIGQQSSDLLGGILPQINELAQTGFGDRIADLSSFLFQNDIAPQLEEQFGAQLGLDTGDADLRAALIREGQRTSFEAANQSVQNQILGLQMAQQAPGMVAEQAGGVEQLLQQGSRQASPEGQLLDLLMMFGGVDTQAGGIGGSQDRSKSYGFGMGK